MGKTKEIKADFKRKKEDLTPVIIKAQQAEVVETYKYLSVFLDN